MIHVSRSTTPALGKLAGWWCLKAYRKLTTNIWLPHLSGMQNGIEYGTASAYDRTWLSGPLTSNSSITSGSCCYYPKGVAQNAFWAWLRNKTKKNATGSVNTLLLTATKEQIISTLWLLADKTSVKTRKNRKCQSCRNLFRRETVFTQSFHQLKKKKFFLKSLDSLPFCWLIESLAAVMICILADSGQHACLIFIRKKAALS